MARKPTCKPIVHRLPWWTIFVFIFIVSTFSSVLAQDSTRSDITEVTAAVPRNFPPYYDVDESGKPIGFAIDLMERIATMEGLKVTYLIENSWTDVAKAVKSGRAILIPNIGISPKRKDWLDYTSPIETFPVSIFVRKHTADIKGIDELIGRKVAVVKFNVAVALVKEHEGIDSRVFNEPREALFELLSGRMDAMVYPSPVFIKIAREAKIEDRFKIVGKPLKEIKRAIGVKKGHELLGRLDRAVNNFVKTTDYQHIYVKWFGKPQPFWTISKVIILMSGLLLTLIVAMSVWRYFSIVKINKELSISITEQEKAEQALRESERSLSEAQRIAHLGNWDLDPVKNELRWSDEVFRIFGLKPQEFEGTYEGFLERVHPDDRGAVGTSYKNSVKNNAQYDIVYRIVRLDGKVRYVHDKAENIKDETGNATRVIGTVKDITEQKKLEEQLHQSQKMEAIGKLAGGVAHDFNNLLTTIMGYTDIMLMQIDQESPLRSSMEEIKRASDRAASLTNQLLAFSRKQMIQPVVLNINRAIAEMDKMLRRLIGEDIDLATILEPELWKIKFDAGQMDQVVMNLAVNAKDAMPKGGKLTIETANVDLDEVYARQHGIKLKPGPFVVLAVSDTGMGIDEETQSRIFEPFFTTKENGKGTGLGLSTVYGIVNQSGGFIWVYSEPGRGTMFKIYLPKTKEEEAFVAEAQMQPQNLEGNETILLAEDEDSARKLMRSALQEYGYWVLEAQDGREALQLSEHHKGPIHLLLTDVVMPRMSGRELAEHLQPLQPKMKVLYMSGYTDNAIVHHGVLESGMQFIQKPFTPKVLVSKIRRVLDT